MRTRTPRQAQQQTNYAPPRQEYSGKYRNVKWKHTTMDRPMKSKLRHARRTMPK